MNRAPNVTERYLDEATPRGASLMKREVVLPVLALALLALVPLSGSAFYTEVVTKVMIMAMFAMSLDLLVGSLLVAGFHLFLQCCGL